MTLVEKIDYEFRCFYLDQMRTSKENIFAHSREIELKKRISDELLILSKKVNERTEAMMMLQNNLLESLFGYYQDVCSRRAEEKEVKEVVEEWLTFVLNTE